MPACGGMPNCPLLLRSGSRWWDDDVMMTIKITWQCRHGVESCPIAHFCPDLGHNDNDGNGNGAQIGFPYLRCLWAVLGLPGTPWWPCQKGKVVEEGTPR